MGIPVKINEYLILSEILALNLKINTKIPIIINKIPACLAIIVSAMNIELKNRGIENLDSRNFER